MMSVRVWLVKSLPYKAINVGSRFAMIRDSWLLQSLQISQRISQIEGQKTCDFTNSVSLASGVDFCYISVIKLAA